MVRRDCCLGGAWRGCFTGDGSEGWRHAHCVDGCDGLCGSDGWCIGLCLSGRHGSHICCSGCGHVAADRFWAGQVLRVARADQLEVSEVVIGIVAIAECTAGQSLVAAVKVAGSDWGERITLKVRSA